MVPDNGFWLKELETLSLIFFKAILHLPISEFDLDEIRENNTTIIRNDGKSITSYLCLAGWRPAEARKARWRNEPK